MANDAPLELASRAEAAMLAAAVGDALGWPQEDRASRVGGRRGVEPELAFTEWRRREGGRWAAHEEVIPPGTYSDDTQLILAVARSLLRGADWWRFFTTVELPFWPLYERGGGGATRRAADSWAKGSPPWQSQKTSRSYFEAGGNGVAMRVLPHVIRHAEDESFDGTAESVMADGIATHGHPRALVGALAYAYALWLSLRRSEKLGYGQLLDETLAGIAIWGQRPRPRGADPSWEEMTASSAGASYDSVWEATVAEMQGLLETARDGIARGSLAVDRDTLEKLGSSGGPMTGAGTVTAAAAVFLASRYAARPAQGLVAAAFAHRADTDTIASMVGAILGAIAGDEWLGRTLERLQDRAYVAVVARHLVDDAALAPVQDGVPQLTDRALRQFWEKIDAQNAGADVVLPDGRYGTIRARTTHETRSSNRITSWLVETGDGQTISLKRVARVKRDEQLQPGPAPKTRNYKIGVIIEVADLEESVRFYRDVLGLEISKRAPRYVSFAGLLALVPASPDTLARADAQQLALPETEDAFGSRQTVTIFIPLERLESVRADLARHGHTVSEYGERDGRRMFRCLDPDANVIELRELNGS